MGCKTRTAGRVINEKCDACEHSLHSHNILFDPSGRNMTPMPEDGWPCLACDWERRLAVLEADAPYACGWCGRSDCDH